MFLCLKHFFNEDIKNTKNVFLVMIGFVKFYKILNDDNYRPFGLDVFRIH